MPKESNGRHERSLNRFYVYALADPSNDEVFYIGKGSGGRVSMHAKLVVGMTQGKYLTPRELTNGMADVARAYWDGSWRTDSLISDHA